MENKYRSNGRIWYVFFLFFLCCLGSICRESGENVGQSVDPDILRSRLSLETKIEAETDLKISKGTYAVYEDRKSQTGRMIHLDVVVLHAKTENPRPDPIFILAEIRYPKGLRRTGEFKYSGSGLIRDLRPCNSSSVGSGSCLPSFLQLTFDSTGFPWSWGEMYPCDPKTIPGSWLC